MERGMLPKIVGLFGLLTLAGTASAAPPSKRECIAANETGQELVLRGRLREASARFEACAVQACPAVLRKDCVARLEKARGATPTVTFVVRDGRDRTPLRASVTVDGEPEANTVTETTSLPLDPGDHTVVIGAEGYVSVTRPIHLNENQSTQVVVDLSRRAAPPVEALSPPATSSPTVGASPRRSEAPAAAETSAAGSPLRTWSYVLGGAGIVGLGLGTYFGLSANATYEDSLQYCEPPSGGTRQCRTPGLAGGADAENQALASTVSFAVGAALIAGALVMFLVAPRDARSAAARWNVAHVGRW